MCKSQGIKRPSDIDLPKYRISLCKEHYSEWFRRRIQKTIKKYKMFSEDEKILIAVSGGKDCFALWHSLVNLGYEVDGLFIDLGIEKISEKAREIILAFAKRLGRDVHVVELKKELATIPNLRKVIRKPTCSICGTIKRYYMNKTARDLGYDVLTTGHNLDDEVSVLFGNIINWNIEFLKKQYPVLREGDGFVRKVKPLCKISEKENRIYCEFNDIIYFKDPCPYSKQATSLKYKALLDQLESEFFGKKLDFYSNFLKKMYPLLNQKIQKKGVGSCKICGEPCFSDKCSVCYIREKLSKSQSISS